MINPSGFSYEHNNLVQYFYNKKKIEEPISKQYFMNLNQTLIPNKSIRKLIKHYLKTNESFVY